MPDNMAHSARATFLCFFNGPPLGVAVFSRALLRELIPILRSSGWDVEILCSTDAYRYLSEDKTIRPNIENTPELDSFLRRFIYLYTLWKNPETGKSCTISLTNALALPKKPARSFINVIHDLNEFESTAKYGAMRSWLRRRIISWAVKYSTRIICISDWSLQQTLKYVAHAGTQHIDVINNGAGNTLPLVARAAVIKKQILVVGRIDPEGKNLWLALECIRRWASQDDALSFVFVGGINKSTETEARNFLREVSLTPRCNYLGQVSDAQLALLYSESEFLLFLSKLEGFGMPPFEAIGAGCPVVVHSENNAIKNLAPTSVHFIHPEVQVPHIEEIRRSLAKLDTESGRKIVSALSWRSTAESYHRSIRNALEMQ